MLYLYFMAFIPVVVGFVLWYKFHSINVWEWIIGAAAGFLACIIFSYIAVAGMTTDYEVWSGCVSNAVYYPRWVEEYQKAVYTTVTDSKGHTHSRFSHYETCHDTHYEHWTVYHTFGSNNVSKEYFDTLPQLFNCPLITETPHKSGFHSGDRNVYKTVNKSTYIEPVVSVNWFENRVQASPSVFSFIKVPEDVPVFDYKYPSSCFVSNRLYGPCSVDLKVWDQMNTRLGPTKKVNVILMNFGDQDSSIAQYQQAKWVGGKKNDLVLCYGKGWSFVFGWTEQEIVKRNLETILLNNKVDNTILPLIEREIQQNYIIKDWKKFDYLTISPPTWTYVLLTILMLGSLSFYYYWATQNDWDKIVIKDLNLY